ncbi:hypothetical protein RND81_13G006600 [Saponaria officinalis]|uniref:F-box associated beta-propeller type 1 domain-containing protein n=1 Tax=Saponaria officinalis TaxID=3572 RepID=A0AAW1GUP3_SAPOF
MIDAALLLPLLRFLRYLSLAQRHRLRSRLLQRLPPQISRPLPFYCLSSASYATFRWPKGTVSVLGSCNGFLLKSHGHDSVVPLVLLNPSTRTYIVIRSNTISRDVSLPWKGNLGFGFDHSSNDYKIVVVQDIDATAYSSVMTRFTMVYSVNSKSWGVVDQTNPSDSMERRYGGVLINNHLLHWMFWSPSKHKRRIGCFNVCSEKWVDDVLLPGYYYDTNHKNYLLDVGVLDGYLFSSFENKVDYCYDVWVMKEYGVQESWMKLLTVAT